MKERELFAFWRRHTWNTTAAEVLDGLLARSEGPLRDALSSRDRPVGSGDKLFSLDNPLDSAGFIKIAREISLPLSCILLCYSNLDQPRSGQ